MGRKRGASVDIAFEKIRKMIEHYELSPMDVVSEIDIAGSLKISRTPVREAIYKLLDYGLIMRDGTKIIVKPITIKDVIEILQVRESIELMAAKLIVNNGGLTKKQKESISSIQKTLQTSINAQNLDANFKTDSLFHRELVSFSGNERFVEIIGKLDIQGERLRWLTTITPTRYDFTCTEHESILLALEALDLPRTEEAIRIHFGNTLQNYQQILQNSQWNNILKTLNQLVKIE